MNIKNLSIYKINIVMEIQNDENEYVIYYTIIPKNDIYYVSVKGLRINSILETDYKIIKEKEDKNLESEIKVEVVAIKAKKNDVNITYYYDRSNNKEIKFLNNSIDPKFLYFVTDNGATLISFEARRQAEEAKEATELFVHILTYIKFTKNENSYNKEEYSIKSIVVHTDKLYPFLILKGILKGKGGSLNYKTINIDLHNCLIYNDILISFPSVTAPPNNLDDINCFTIEIEKSSEKSSKKSSKKSS
jgi:hypothetical protein